MALTKIDDRGLKTPIDLLDNEKLRLGTGNDLEIFHSGSNSMIKDTGTGGLNLATSRLNVNNAADNENMITATENGAVELYYDNTKRLETDASGVKLSNGRFYSAGTFAFIESSDTSTTTLTLKKSASGADSIDYLQCRDSNNNIKLSISGSGDIDIQDNAKLLLGTSDDLQIYHDGSNSFIKNSTGGLDLNSDTIHLRNGANTETYARFLANGAAELYYDNHKAFETTSFGSQTVFSSANGSTPIFKVLHGNLSQGVGIGYDSINSIGSSTNVPLFLRSKGTGNVEIVAANGDKMAKFFPDNQVELYHNNGKKFETTGAGVKVTGDGEIVRMEGADNDTFIKLLGTSNVNVIFGHLNDQGFVGNSTNHDFFIRTNNQNRISISNSGTLSGDLNDTSDENLKENIVAISDGAIANIKKLRPVNFDWKDSEKAKNQSGFIAQELKTIFPNLVVGEEYDESKEESFGLAINTSGVVAHLTKALQEEISKREALEARVATLEAA